MKTLPTFTSFLWVCVLVGNLSLSGQTPYAGQYEDQLEPYGQLLASGYNFTEEKIDDTTFIRKTFHPESGQITRLITYGSVLFQEKNGFYRAWYDDGTLAFEGYYQGDEKTGHWTEKVHEQGSYQNGKRSGTWTRFSEEGKIVFTQHYKQGRPDGELVAYDEQGRVQFKEWYADGEKVRSTAASEDSEHGVFQNRVDVLPRFPGCEDINGTDTEKFRCANGKLARYLRKNQRYPKKARTRMIQGEVLVQFTVDTQGGIGAIRVLTGCRATSLLRSRRCFGKCLFGGLVTGTGSLYLWNSCFRLPIAWTMGRYLPTVILTPRRGFRSISNMWRPAHIEPESGTGQSISHPYVPVDHVHRGFIHQLIKTR